jgi:hypothetical protein
VVELFAQHSDGLPSRNFDFPLSPLRGIKPGMGGERKKSGAPFVATTFPVAALLAYRRRVNAHPFQLDKLARQRRLHVGHSFLAAGDALE